MIATSIKRLILTSCNGMGYDARETLSSEHGVEAGSIELHTDDGWVVVSFFTQYVSVHHYEGRVFGTVCYADPEFLGKLYKLASEALWILQCTGA